MLKKLLGLAVLLLLLCCVGVQPAKATTGQQLDTIGSPDGRLQFSLYLNDGRLSYLLTLDGKAVLEQSALGIQTQAVDFSQGLTYIGMDGMTATDTTFSLMSGKTSTVADVNNQTTFGFSKDGRTMGLEVKVYNDGVGFRYVLDGTGTDTVVTEATAMHLPDTAVSWGMTYSDAYEGVYHDSLPVNRVRGSFIMPFLSKVYENTFVLLLQANVDGDYVGSRLVSSGDGVLEVQFIAAQREPVRIEYPFTSPWRIIAVGTIQDIAETNIVECFADETTMTDTSWIQPGVTAWTWYNGDPRDDVEVYKDYVDFVAEMGWAYILLDEGWQPGSQSGGYRGTYAWVDELIAYADDKGVGLLVWTQYTDLSGDKIERLQEWADMGIKGIKVDFFNSETQEILEEMDRILSECERVKLLVNYHGVVAPVGARRTHPHELSREGVNGEEQNKWSDSTWGNQNAVQNTILPFTRNIAGPMDYTPAYSTNIKDGDRTMANSTALTVVFECGIPCFADTPAVYRAAATYDFLRNMPAVWDDFRFIDGYPGTHTAVARRSGDDWYIGAITVEARELKVKLDFLGEGTYYASVYTDGDTPADVDIDYKLVTSKDTLTLPMAYHGGAVVKLTQQQPTMPSELALTTNTLMLGTGQVATLDYTYANAPTYTKFNWVSDDPSIATIVNGAVQGVSPGRTTVALLAPDGTRHTATVTVIKGYALLDTWQVVRPNQPFVYINEPTMLTIQTEYGGLWNINDGHGSVMNLHLVSQTLSGGEDFSITVKLTFAPMQDYQKAALTCYLGDGNFVSVFRRYHSSYGGNVFMTSMNVNGKASEGQSIADKLDDTCYLKLEKTGDTFTGYCSADGETWTKISSRTQPNLHEADAIRVGFYAANGAVASTDTTAIFEDFALNGTVIPFAEAFDMEVIHVEPVTVQTAVGTAPTLPATVTVVYSDGSEAQAAVAWDEYSQSQLSRNGSFTVNGTITDTLTGTTQTATATVMVGTAQADSRQPLLVAAIIMGVAAVLAVAAVAVVLLRRRRQ